MTELKLCPFCGSEPAIFEGERDDVWGKVIIGCADCNAITYWVYYGIEGLTDEELLQRGADSWNTRALE